MARVAWWRRSGPAVDTPDEPDWESERKIIEAGRAAKLILDSGAIDDVRGELMARWANSVARDYDMREELHSELRACERIRHELQRRADELAKRGIDE